MDDKNNDTIQAQAMKGIALSSDLIEQINQKKRSNVPSRITEEEMPEDIRHNKLKQESKKLAE
jgi:hypothetical protein